MLNTEYLLELMKKHGNMTLGQLAQKSGISKSQISRMLNGERGIGVKSIKGLLKAFPEADRSILFIFL